MIIHSLDSIIHVLDGKWYSGGNNFWVIIVDEYINMYFSLFMKKKSDLSREVRVILNEIRDSKEEIMSIRVDNDGENSILQRDCIRDKMGIKFEYT